MTGERQSSVGSSGLSLAEKLRTGSPSAWKELVELYGPLLHQWCRKGNVPNESIPDVAQDVLVSAFRGLDRFDSTRQDATFQGWLWTIARSRIVDFHRRENGKPAATGGSTAYGNLQSLPDPLPLEDPTETNHSAALLHRALDQIRSEFTQSTWQSFWRSAVLGHPTDMIAAENGVTPAAIRKAKSRVLGRLRKQLGDG